MSATSVGARPTRRGLTARHREWVLGYGLIVPAFCFVLGLILYPAAWGIYFAFTDKVVGKAAQFVGLRNFFWVLQWPDFGLMIVNTVTITVLAVAIKTLVGMTMALVLNEDLPARPAVRALMFLPWTVPTFVAGLIWRWLFDDQNGLFNWGLLKLGLIGEPIPWLGTSATAFMAVIVVLVWKGFPFFGISYLAGLQAIPAELYEAAQVDGATAWQRFRFITIPGLQHVILITVMLSTIWTANTFDLIYLMTGGGPSNATEVFTLLTYQLGVQNGRIGEAATVPLMAMPFFAALIVVLTSYMLSREEA
ncbi:MAG TPA: sugar ABC transporter permease [Chloroflexota bacterium]|nr:sugar ABC transporter permease [Chloroflexota bacterium]